MEIISKITESIHVEDSITFCSDIQANIMSYLKNKYLNVCFQGIYIMNIVNIVKTSGCIINNLSKCGEGLINVEFAVSGLKYAKGDIISGIVIQKADGIICGQYGNIANVNIIPFIQVKGNNVPLSLKENTIVAVIVENAQHTPFGKVDISAKLLVPELSFTTYYVNGELKRDDFIHINKLILAIENEMAIRPDDKKMEFLERVYYYKDEDIKNTKDYTNIIEELKSENFSSVGEWSRPLEICRSSPYVRREKLTKASLYTPPNVAICSILLNILNWLKTMREQHTIFTEELIKSNTSLWKLIKHTK